jgi:hypothetical protein
MVAEDALRLTLLSGLVGFVVFCASYATIIWRKRNRPASANRLARFGLTLLVLGGIVAGGSWVATAFQDRSGIVSGDDIFVIHSRRDAGLSRVSREDFVEEGAILAEFVPSANEAELALLDNRIDEARSRLRGLELRTPAVDALLAQRRDQLQAQINQSRGFEFDLMRAAREFEKEEIALETVWTREQSQIESELADARLQVASLTEQIAIAEEARDRAVDLRARDLTPMQVLDERNNVLLSLRRDHDRADGVIYITERRLAALESRYSAALATLALQRMRLNEDLTREGENVAALRLELVKVEEAIQADQYRAGAAMREDMVAARHHLAALETDRRRAVEATQVRSPIAGRVIYRHSAPGLVSEGAPILAVSAGSGFVATVRLSEADAHAVAEAGSVRFTTSQPLLTRFFTGEYRDQTPVSDGRDEVLVRFSVNLPPDAIMMLAASGTTAISAALQWRPPIIHNTSFRAALAAITIGLIILAWSSLGRQPINGLAIAQRSGAALVPVGNSARRGRHGAITLALVASLGVGIFFSGTSEAMISGFEHLASQLRQQVLEAVSVAG